MDDGFVSVAERDTLVSMTTTKTRDSDFDGFTVTELMILPCGLSPDDEDWTNLKLFAVFVRWKGEYRGKSGGGYSVEGLGSFLSRSGEWSRFPPQEFRRWQYRFETLGEAVAAAKSHVDEVVVNGRTYAQWRELFDGRGRGQTPEDEESES